MPVTAKSVVPFFFPTSSLPRTIFARACDLLTHLTIKKGAASGPCTLLVAQHNILN